MKKEVQRLLEKADHALEVAESLYKQGFIQDASSRIYYEDLGSGLAITHFIKQERVSSTVPGSGLAMSHFEKKVAKSLFFTISKFL